MWSRNVGRSVAGVRNVAQWSAQEGWLFVDSVFPIRLGIWDIRHYIGVFREESLLGELESRLSVVQKHGFRVLALQPYQKDGGVFVKFAYRASDRESALRDIEDELRAEADKHAMPSWAGFDWGNVWLVKGQPWLEDMNRYPSTLLKVGFEGPDVQEETLYELFRPYGRVHDLTPPKPVSPGTLRSADVSFARVRSAAVARNVIHGYQFPGTSSQLTRLQILYQRPLQAHVIRNWLASHPRIVLPIVFFLLGTLTYTIFDPIRALSVEGKMLNWFDYREFGIIKWLQNFALDRFSLPSRAKDAPATDLSGWKERREAEIALKGYLTDPPLTVAFVHGPQGSGKSHLVTAVLQESGRKTLVIDCAELNKATTDSRLVAALAQQTSYRPVFTSLNSLTNIIDIASMGVIGQKAGLSNSLTDQLKQILEVVASALINVNRSLLRATKQEYKARREAEALKIEEGRRAERIRQGTWHDGRIDCVAGNGVMSELGVGDETFGNEVNSVGSDMGEAFMLEELKKEKEAEDELIRKERTAEEVEAIAALPVVVIKNYGARGNIYREELQNVLGQWAATLVENKIAHVVVISDNREKAKLITRALPSKPLNFIPLYDADTGSTLTFVKQRLRDAGMTTQLTKPEIASIECLGGRASDLEILLHKVRSGQAIEDAVEDIISRSISELRKNAFGEDIEDAKSLSWTREQVWTVLKQLAKKAELPYYDVLASFPFKGDELSLRSMEHAELISIGTLNGRPSTIRPGKPVFKYVFERLVNDPTFRATQDMAVNDKLITISDNTIKTCESELTMLKEITGPVGFFNWLWQSKRASTERRRYLLRKMYEAQARIQMLEKQNVDLKKTLARGT